MKKLADNEVKSNLDFFGRHGVEEDPNFSAARNKAVIEGTIRKNDALRKKKLDAYWKGKGNKTGLHERIDMAASFMKAKDRGGRGANNITGYLGKRLVSKLKGEQIMQRLKDNLIVRN